MNKTLRTPHTPARMCVACRTRQPAHAMLRLRRRPDGQVVPAGPSSEGRSAYLCPSHSCFEQALKRRAFTRALTGPKGLSVAAPGSTLWVDIERAVTNQVDQLQRTSATADRKSDRCRRLNQLESIASTMSESQKGVRRGQGSSL